MPLDKNASMANTVVQVNKSERIIESVRPEEQTGGKMIIITNVVRVIASALLALHLFTLTPCSHAGDSSGTAAYGTKVKLSASGTLRYPDFELTYMGKRRVTPPQYPRGWWIHDFKVGSKSGQQTVSWAAGTGDIGPTRFKVSGVDFQIELSHSDKLGPLREDEMVVSSIKVVP
jgi:hypothetical protein